MTALHDLQNAIARAVITGACDDAAAAVVADAPGAAARLGIYHHHYRVTLIDTLASTFPATRAAVGEGHFRAAVRGFIRTQPPTEPSLSAYGADFPAFLAQLPPLASWPYLADLARLDWAVNVAFHAPDAPAIAPQCLATLAPARLAGARLRLHPSSTPLASAFPLDRIRRALLAGETGEATDGPETLCRLLVFRAGHDVGWLNLPLPAFAFVTALADDQSVGRATASAVAIDPSFDPAALLAALLSHQVVVGLSTPDP